MVKGTLAALIETLPQRGTVRWIGLRPERRANIKEVRRVEATTEHGLIGDRYAGRDGKRHVTLIQHEHLVALSSILDPLQITPTMLRRNIAVSGINLLALKDRAFSVGDATLEYTGLCHPCSYMEKTLGAGGYNAMRGHGGITARVVVSGSFEIGSMVGVAD